MLKEKHSQRKQRSIELQNQGSEQNHIEELDEKSIDLRSSSSSSDDSSSESISESEDSSLEISSEEIDVDSEIAASDARLATFG